MQKSSETENKIKEIYLDKKYKHFLEIFFFMIKKNIFLGIQINFYFFVNFHLKYFASICNDRINFMIILQEKKKRLKNKN